MPYHFHGGLGSASASLAEWRLLKSPLVCAHGAAEELGMEKALRHHLTGFMCPPTTQKTASNRAKDMANKLGDFVFLVC